jgi:choline dehydrogenase
VTYICPEGERVTSETAYLSSDVLKRPNLTVVIHARVTKLLLSAQDKEKHVVGVEFACDDAIERSPTRYRVKARKEVVLSYAFIDKPLASAHNL